MDKHQKHEGPIPHLARQLRGMGCLVKVLRGGKVALLVDDHLLVSVRVAYRKRRKHSVTVHGHHYEYYNVYFSSRFNFRQAGRPAEHYADVVICYAMGPRGGIEATFVIPFEAIAANSFSLHNGKEDYRGRYAEYATDHPARVVQKMAGKPRCKKIQKRPRRAA